MTAIVLTVAGVAITLVSFFALAWWVLGYFTRDTGTHAVPRRQSGGWDEPSPGEWLPAAPAWPPPEVTHEEDWRRHSDVIVASVYHPTPAEPPLDYQIGDNTLWRGMRAITGGRQP